MRAWMALLVTLAAGMLPRAQTEIRGQAARQAAIIDSVSSTGPQGGSPIFQFGVIADVQYADKDSQGRRNYRESANKLQACVADLNRHDLVFVVNLGDIVDGHGAATSAELDFTLNLLGPLKPRVRHVIGNHCLAVNRPELLEKLQLESSYYEFEYRGWRFLVLDGMEISLKAPPVSKELKKARQYLQQDPSLADYNGAIGEEQMAWLKVQLSEAGRMKQKAIVFCHHPALPEAADRSVVLWNYRKLLEVLEGSGCVVAYLSGHHHPGGYAERNGIHHLTIPGVVETPPGSNSYVIVSAFEDRLQVQGFGSAPSRVLVRK